MSALSIQVPFPVFQDRDGQPLDNGYVWIGVANLQPQTNPVVAYFDEALTIIAAQPLRTINGYISNAGTPAQVFVDAVNFSILVQDSNGTMVYSFPDGTGLSPNAAGIIYDPAGTGAVPTTVQAKLREFISVKDFGAVGNGVANDAIAVTNAFNASNGVRVLFPSGVYKLSSTVAAPTGSRAYMEYGSSFLTNTPTNVDYLWENKNSLAVIASVAEVQHLFEQSSYPFEGVGGYWPSGPVGTYFGISKEFNSTYGNGTDSPYAAQWIYAVNNNSTASVVGQMVIARTITNNDVAFGINSIATNEPSTTGAKLVGMEIDVESSAGTTISTQSAGLYVNIFNTTNTGPAMQIGGIGGGTWNNGVIANNISTSGAAFGDQAGLSCGWGLALVNGTYANAAIELGPQRNLSIKSNSSVTNNIYANASDNFFFDLGKDIYFTSPSSTQGNRIATVRSVNGIESAIFYVVSAYGASSANTAVGVGKDSVTSRSINAGGTINASGADYAEYEYKNDTCGEVLKGQIIGFDADGKVTDKYDSAVSFGVKTTNPNIVGGDTWFEEVGDAPIAPEYTPPDIERPVHPNQTIRKSTEQSDAELADFEQKTAAYEKTLSDHKAQWEQTVLASHQNAVNVYKAQLEMVRATVDRISYCGKVPVNVTGAAVGEYIIPTKDGDGIKGVCVASPTFEQYRNSVGQVRKILSDGRAEIVVKAI
jgi:hypothetical protein